MASSGNVGLGAKLSMNRAGGGATYTDIGMVTGFNPDLAKAIGETTHLLGGGPEEFLPGLREATIGFESLFLPDINIGAGDGAIISELLARTDAEYMITWSNSAGTQWKFTAFIRELDINIEVNEPITVTGTLRVKKPAGTDAFVVGTGTATTAVSAAAFIPTLGASSTGVRLRWDRLGASSFTEIAEVKSGRISFRVAEGDATKLNSEGWMDFLAATINTSFSASLNWLPADASQGADAAGSLYHSWKDIALDAGNLIVVPNWKWIFNDPGAATVNNMAFRGMITALRPRLATKSVVTADLEVQGTGAVTLSTETRPT